MFPVFIKIDFNPTKNAIDRKVAQASGFNIHNFIAKEAVPVAIVMMIIGLNYASILTFLKSFAEQRHLLEASSYFFIFYAIASLITRPIAGRMIDAKNENVVVYPAFLALIITFVLLVFSYNGWVLLLAGVFLGIGYGNLFFYKPLQLKCHLQVNMELQLQLTLLIRYWYWFWSIVAWIIYRFNHVYSSLFHYGVVALCTVLYLIVHGRKVNGNTY